MAWVWRCRLPHGAWATTWPSEIAGRSKLVQVRLGQESQTGAGKANPLHNRTMHAWSSSCDQLLAVHSTASLLGIRSLVRRSPPNFDLHMVARSSAQSHVCTPFMNVVRTRAPACPRDRASTHARAHTHTHTHTQTNKQTHKSKQTPSLGGQLAYASQQMGGLWPRVQQNSALTRRLARRGRQKVSQHECNIRVHQVKRTQCWVVRATHLHAFVPCSAPGPTRKECTRI